jgi:hypothetical protein
MVYKMVWYWRAKKDKRAKNNSSGGGKGGVGYNNVPSGHKGED